MSNHERWPTASLSDVASIERTSVGPAEIEPGAAYVGLENVASDGTFVDVGKARAAQVKSNKFRFSDRHVLYGKLRPYLAKIAAPDFAGVCSTDILPIAPAPEMDRRFLLHYLRTPAMVEHASRLATGANLPRLSPKALATFDVPVPPIEEQRRIVAVLDAADALRTKRREALAKLDALTEAIFIDMFGDPRLGTDDPARLADHVEVVTKGTTPTSVGMEFTDQGIHFVRATDLVGGTVDARKVELRISASTHASLARSQLKPRDVLVSIAGTIGRVAVVPDDAPEMNCNQAVALVRTKPSLLPGYLAAWLQTGHAQDQMTGSKVTGTISNLSLASIKRLAVPLPDLAAQATFVERVESVAAQRNRVTIARNRFGDLFASLQQRAFRGEL